MASSAQAKQFIEIIAPMIQDEAKARGYKVCSPIIAQACVESNYGTSKLSQEPFWNFFGMKCGSSWKGRSVNMATKEEYNSQLVSIRDNFRCYDSMEDGVKGYFDFISTKRYENLKDAPSPMVYLGRIKADGYATSSSYVNTCMSVVDKYELIRYDTDSVYYKAITPELILDIVNGEYGVGNIRRQKLTAQGYNYDDVRKKINDLDKIGKSFLPDVKNKAGEYWKSVLKLMLL